MSSLTPSPIIAVASKPLAWMRAEQLAAFAALDQLPPAQNVTSVSYESQGRLLIVASAKRLSEALESATTLATALNVTVLVPTEKVEYAEHSLFATAVGNVVHLTGYLGQFNIELALAGRPQNDLARFDLILDLSEQATIPSPQPPRGYFFAIDETALATAVQTLPQWVGEFEKPKFFAYKSTQCAHARNQVVGCNKCVDVCSTQAITGTGDHVEVNPHLCMGCGACAAVCPTGAMRFQYPRQEDRGEQLKALVRGFNAAPSAPAPILLLHSEQTNARVNALLANSTNAVRVLPLSLWHSASTGLDSWIAALVYGFSGVIVVDSADENAHYGEPLSEQVELANTIVAALTGVENYTNAVGRGDRIGRVTLEIEGALLSAISAMPTTSLVTKPATFVLSAEKRTALEFAMDHLLQYANVGSRYAANERKIFELPAGAPYGAVAIDKDKCTLCMACAGACPASALIDTPEEPKLRFVERNCVQCGVCEKTCPEKAISLVARLNLMPAARGPQTVNESRPFHCVTCSKPFAVEHMINRMLGKLATHSMFAGDGINRLKMCADCRVVDMMSNKNEVSIKDL
jgi:ferredoxin